MALLEGQVEHRAPIGMFRVVRSDFGPERNEWVEADCGTREKAMTYTKNGSMNPTFVYDDQGKLQHD